MSLSSLQLDAFLAVCRARSFSKAAALLHVTQSALSQRIQHLEEELGTALFVRDPSGIRITERGEHLLRYTQWKEAVENEVVQEFKGRGATRGGVVRIAGYSSVMRSVVLPVLSPWFRANPEVQCELMSREMKELPGLLARAEADFVILDSPWRRKGIVRVDLGKEEYVMVESAKYRERENWFLDHDPDDMATHNFFRSQRTGRDGLKRCYLDDVYGILDGVRKGLGRAVMSSHLVGHDPLLAVVKGFRPLKRNVTLHYHEQSFYPRMHEEIISQLKAHCSERLDRR